MRANYIVSACIFMLLHLCTVSGEGNPQESLDDSDYLVVLLKPTGSDINLRSVLAEIELEFKVNGIKFISQKEGLLAEEGEKLATGSIADSITALKIQLLKLKTHLTELETSLIKSEGLKEDSAYSILTINNQINVLKAELKEIGTLITFNDREFSALERNLSELNDEVSRQREQLSELQKEKDDLLQYVHKSISGSHRFIALLFIILLMIVSLMAFGTIKERFFSQRDQWL